MVLHFISKKIQASCLTLKKFCNTWHLAYTYPSSQFVPLSPLLTRLQLCKKTVVFFLCFFLKTPSSFVPQSANLKAFAYTGPSAWNVHSLLGMADPLLVSVWASMSPAQKCHPWSPCLSTFLQCVLFKHFFHSSHHHVQ